MTKNAVLFLTSHLKAKGNYKKAGGVKGTD